MSDRETFEKTGRLWRRAAVQTAHLSALESLFDGPAKAGGRVVLTQALAEVLNPVDVLGTDLVDAFPNLRPTRVVTFDKSETANWGVPWHQDRVIAVQERHDVDGFENWSP